MITRLIGRVQKALSMTATKLNEKQQLELQLKMQMMQNQASMQNIQNQYNQAAAQNNQYTGNTSTGNWGIGSITGGGGGVGSGGSLASQQTAGIYPQGIYPLTPQPSLDFQVDMIFAAVEKHLRTIIKEEIQNALQSLPRSEAEERALLLAESLGSEVG